MADGDLTCTQMAELFDRLARKPTPIADAYKEEVVGTPRSRWSRTEQVHMSGWFDWNTTTGEGAYSRQKPNNSAKRCYNRLQSDAGLLWIAEALEFPPLTVKEAADAARAVKDHRSKCKAIRQVVPWPDVYEHALVLIRRFRFRGQG